MKATQQEVPDLICIGCMMPGVRTGETSETEGGTVYISVDRSCPRCQINWKVRRPMVGEKAHEQKTK